jgi:hypothetical protein
VVPIAQKVVSCEIEWLALQEAVYNSTDKDPTVKRCCLLGSGGMGSFKNKGLRQAIG